MTQYRRQNGPEKGWNRHVLINLMSIQRHRPCNITKCIVVLTCKDACTGIGKIYRVVLTCKDACTGIDKIYGVNVQQCRFMRGNI